MIPVDQTIVGEVGNCMSACAASLLELPLDEIPYFKAMPVETWFNSFCKFFEDQGYSFRGSFYFTNQEPEQEWHDLLERCVGIDGYFMVAGTSPRGYDCGHAVIYKDGKLAHDPHPSRAGIERLWYAYMIRRPDPE